MFKDIKVGDQVIVNGGLNEVTHVTKTRFKCGFREFLKENGKRYGASNIWTAHSAQKAEGQALELAQKDLDLSKARSSVAFAQELIIRVNSRVCPSIAVAFTTVKAVPAMIVVPAGVTTVPLMDG